MTWIKKHSVILAVIGLIIAGTAVYANSLSAPFIFDDIYTIVDNPTIRHLWPPGAALTPPKDIPLRDRPLVNLTFALNYSLSGLKVWSYHALNLLIHLLAGLVLFGLTRRLLKLIPAKNIFGEASAWLAFSAALIWLIHPLQTESVTYISQRSESLCGLFYLLTLYCFLRSASSSSSRRWYLASIMSCALGMGSKAVMVTAPLMVLIFDRTFLSSSFTRALKSRRFYYPALAATWIIQAFLLASTYYGDIHTHTVPAYAVGQFGVIAHYLKLAFLPLSLCLDYAWPPVDTTGTVILPALLIVSLIGAVIWAIVKKKPWFFSGVWFFLILAPTSSFLPLEDLAFEHRMYLPLAAVTSGAVLAVYRVLFSIKTARFRRLLLFISLLIVVIIMGSLTRRRNRQYQNPVKMWEEVVKQVPWNSRAYYNLGCSWSREGKLNNAIGSYRQALKINPDYTEALNNLGNDLTRMGNAKKALPHLRAALRLQPDSPEILNNLGLALAGDGRTDEAISCYQRVIRDDPTLAEPYYNLGNAFLKLGQKEKAIVFFQQALKLRPGYLAARINLGNAFLQAGLPKAAIREYRQVLHRKPDSLAVRYNLGIALSRGGNIQGARVQWQKIIQFSPNYQPAQQALLSFTDTSR